MRVQLLFGRVVSCHVVHSFVPPHSVPFRQLGGGLSGEVDPLVQPGKQMLLVQTSYYIVWLWGQSQPFWLAENKIQPSHWLSCTHFLLWLAPLTPSPPIIFEGIWNTFMVIIYKIVYVAGRSIWAHLNAHSTHEQSDIDWVDKLRLSQTASMKWTHILRTKWSKSAWLKLYTL